MMAQNRLQCYVCGHAFGRQQMARIDGEENAHKREIAITRRDALGQNPLDITDRTRLCLNCNRLIIVEITALERDPYCFKLNVLRQTQNRTCLFCNAAVNLHRLSIACRVDVFVKRNIYISEITKSCAQHLDDRGFILPLLLPALQFVNRPYSIRGDQMQLFLDELRNAVNNTRVYQNENDFEDDAFQCISPVTKEQFQDLFTYCVPVHSAGHNRNITKKDLMTFLCKLRQGLSDDFLKVIFHYKSRQNVSLAVATVRISLMQLFVPSNIGFAAITREDYIARHCTDFSNELYNPQPENRKALAYIDGSYLRIQKSSNFRTLRQSYSVHKSYHLLKPALVVAPDGYILAIHGPYFSDASNNDAQMLRNEFEQDMQGMREWFQNGDIFIVDRGYRDAIPLLEAMGITHRMPCLLERGQRQFTTEQANESRIVTKTRWVVEARNGHLKSIFKFFANVIQITHTKNLGDFLRIACAIINKYHPPIRMEEANAELARELLQKSRQVNVVQERVDAENLRVLRANWNRLNHQHVRNFPLLTLDYLRELTVGTYQVNLAPSYVQDKLQRDEQEEFQIDVHFDKPSLIRVRVYSRYRNATKHQLWISYNEMEDDNIDNDNDDVEPITGYYCTCQAGARTLGTCAHVASVLWFLGYARHQQRIKYPSTQLLQSVQDAAHRPHQQDPNHGIE